jgi:inner membrane protein
MENLSVLDRFNKWLSESVIIKLISIGILMLLLLIPSSLVQDLIYERQLRADEVIAEVSGKWGAPQTITGPILSVPYKQSYLVDEWTNGVKHTRREEALRTAYFLPETFAVKGDVTPELLHRGIFDVAVYDAKLDIKASFADLSFAKWDVSEIIWSDAKLLVAISDLKGIHENPVIRSGDKILLTESSQNIGIRTTVNAGDDNKQTGIVVPFNWNSADDVQKDFSISLALKGSDRLYFVPVGGTTSVSVSGSWPSPSFDGQMLPTERSVSEKGFDATWKMLSFSRPFSDKWVDNDQSLAGAEFGVRLLIPADQYQKSMRTAKYAALIILLAFTALFLVEITRKVRIHPFQYILVGVALIVYYTLLLSISEHVGYNIAYAISSIATVLLLTLYSMTFLSKQLVLLFSLVMTVFYTFIFVIIQAEDFSLLIGSLGLFLIIALVMYFSRNIKWYKEGPISDSTTEANPHST